MKPSQESYVPSHPDFVVEFAPGEFSAFLKTNKKAFHAGDLLAPLEGLTKSPKAYTSVQCGRGPSDHIELNSDLVYINHSCEPNVAFDLSSTDASKWHVRALERLEVGTPLTFFYPSTEWDMDQAFNCECGAATCLGRIQGAAYISKEDLSARKWTNPWILDLISERDAKSDVKSKIDQDIIQRQREAVSQAGEKCLSCGYGFSSGLDLNRCGCKPIVVI